MPEPSTQRMTRTQAALASEKGWDGLGFALFKIGVGTEAGHHGTANGTMS